MQTPLRWHGRLRDEPTKLPWGYGLEIDLTGVGFESALLPMQGGFGLSVTPHPEETPLPELHAGDEVSVLTEARLPQVFRDEGVFDRRSYLAQQNIDLVATLRAPELIERIAISPGGLSARLARARRRLREEIDSLCGESPQTAAVLRAMLLGDRSFVDRAESAGFQKTGAFHVLVVAGLHVGAIAAVLFWAGKKLRLRRSLTLPLTLMLLFSYVAIVEERPPVLRAAVMTTIVLLGGFFFRRLELLNSAAIAALILLIAKPLALRDSSFQLTFVAVGCIGGLAVPWLEETAQPFMKALRVLKLQYGNKTILLPGDAERQAEHGILSQNRAEALRSEVLKVGHHGGKNSTTEEFLDAVRPQLGIISVGEDNPYGHPSPELLERLQAAGVRVLRTDREGAVHVLTDGKQIEIRCFVTCGGAENTASASVKVPNQKQREEKQ